MPAATESSVYSSIDISAAEPPRTVSGEIDRAPEFAPPEPVRITDVKDEDLVRIMTGLEPFDRVLGGGLVADSAILIGGDPGSGKSTMCIQAIAGVGERVLYATGEETIAQVTMRARRVGAAHPEIWIVPSNDTDEIIEHARKIRPSILVVDSANVIACAGIGGVAGSISQIKESTSRLARFAKREHVILIMIAHVTKDGAIAGPNTLNHLVDVVLLLECAEFGQRRFLRATKNRMGSTQEVGTFEMCADGMICVEPGAGDVPFAIVNEERIEVGAPEVAMQDEVSEAIDVLAAVPEEIR
jgi:DNA repair protein RadA/Sms